MDRLPILKVITILLLIIGPLYSAAGSPQPITDEKLETHHSLTNEDALYKTLFTISASDNISKEMLDESEEIVNRFTPANAYYLPAIHTYGRTCINAGPLGVDYFYRYRIQHMGSAEEEISSISERLFNMYPKSVLERIRKEPKEIKPYLLADISRAFIKNTYFDKGSANIDLKNYRQQFFYIHQKSTPLYDDYRAEIDIILLGIREHIEM